MTKRPIRRGRAKAYTPRGAFLTADPPAPGDRAARERIRDRVRARRLEAKRPR